MNITQKTVRFKNKQVKRITVAALILCVELKTNAAESWPEDVDGETAKRMLWLLKIFHIS